MAKAPQSTSTKPRHALRATSKNTVHPYFIARPDKDAANASWTVAELCKEYEWPTGLDGGGVIALIQRSGGWIQADVDKYFDDAKLPAPNVADHSVDGATHNSNCQNPDKADTEVALDIQTAGAAYSIATGKPATIRIYWSQDLAEALRAASGDKCDVCCISWGADEQTWGRAAADAFNAVAKAAVDSGMIIVAASGDNDSSDGGPTPSNVDFPASSPYVIGCGGTSLNKPPKGAEGQTAANKKHILKEKVWNDHPGDPDGNGTGGGFSEFFPIPDWQLGTIQATKRMVPDVAAHADPASGYQIVLGGQSHIVGGTSAATALYAGLFAAFGPKRGFILPDLYKNQVCFNDIEEGDNGMFRALVGPDACTGLGSPRGARIAERIGSDAATLKRAWELLREARAVSGPDRQNSCPCLDLATAGARSPALAPRAAGTIKHGPPGTYAKTIYLADGPHVYVWDCDGHMIAQEDFRPCNPIGLPPRVAGAGSARAPGPPGSYAGIQYLADGPHVLVWDYDGHKVFQENFGTA